MSKKARTRAEHVIMERPLPLNSWLDSIMDNPDLGPLIFSNLDKLVDISALHRTCKCLHLHFRKKMRRWTQLQRGCTEWNKTGLAPLSAALGQIMLMQWAHEHRSPLTVECALSAATMNQMDVLKYLKENGHPMDACVCRRAAQRNNLQCLVWLHENGVEWNDETTYAAIRNNNVGCLQYAVDNGCAISIVHLKCAVGCGHIACADVLIDAGIELDEDICATATHQGRLTCLKWLHEKHGCVMNMSSALMASKYGHLECLKYVCEKAGIMGENLMFCATMNDQMKCTRYLIDSGCAITQPIVAIAIESGLTKFVEFFIDEGWRPTQLDIARAVRNDFVDILETVLATAENGTQRLAYLVDQACKCALSNDKVKCLAHLYRYHKECINTSTCDHLFLAASYDSVDVFKYLVENKGYVPTYLTYQGAIFATALKCITYMTDKCELRVKSHTLVLLVHRYGKSAPFMEWLREHDCLCRKVEPPRTRSSFLANGHGHP